MQKSKVDINSVSMDLLSVLDGNLFKDFQSAGKNFVEGGYGMAFDHYEKGRYLEAYDLFVTLAAIDTKDKRHWMGIGATAQMLKRYAEAVEAYSVAAHLDSTLSDPYPHFHAAECFYTMGDIKNAWRAIESARKVADNSQGDPHLKSRIALLRKSWYPKAKALAKKK